MTSRNGPKDPEQHPTHNSSLPTLIDSDGIERAIVAGSGRVLAVNLPWLRFARENGDPPLPKIGVGANYLTVCRRAASRGDGYAAHALSGVLAVLREETRLFELDYPCHAPWEARWFRLRATALEKVGGALIEHELIDPQQPRAHRPGQRAESHPEGHRLSGKDEESS
jgi:hypothetical protein